MNKEKRRQQRDAGMSNQQSGGKGAEKGKNKLLWTLVSILIAAGSIWAVASQGKDFSIRTFFAYLSRANVPWLGAAVAAMLGFILFEAYALRSISHAFRYPSTVKDSCLYAAADIYFSAITPSATGGQPACGFLMMKNGIPGTVTTAALLLNLTMYSLAILVIGLVCFLLRPGIFLRFGRASKILIILGYAMQAGLSLFFFLLVKTECLLQRLCGGALRVLGKLRLLRNEEKLQEKLQTAMKDYRQFSAMLPGQGKLIFKVFLFNLLQRASQISVTMFVYLAMESGSYHAVDVWAMQSYVVLGSNCVPVPGAMGVADYLMLDGFGAFLSEQQAVSLELLSRSLSFYCCILICGLAVLSYYWRHKRKGLRD